MPFLNPNMANSKAFEIAVIGGGIAGVTLAVALHHRNVPITLYERASNFHEIGAGVSFTPNAVHAMEACHPGIYAAFDKVCTWNGWASKRGTWFDYLDGTAEKDEIAFPIKTSLGQNGVHRAHFLDELVKLLPKDRIQFGKQIEETREDESTGKIVMVFSDGSTATADAVVGCDGIRSRVREMVVGADHPSVHPSYSHKYAYRGLVPMDKAIEAIGEERARNACMHMGPDGHVLTFPVAHGEKLNIVAFRTTSKEWDGEKMTKSAHRQEALDDFVGYNSRVRGLLELTEEELMVWAIFDLGDNPVPTFYRGRLAISGDAAHATSPHHGAGAGFCIEDSAVMAELLADEAVQSQGDLETVFAAFDASRRERGQWLVQSSRRIGDCYEWRAEGVGRDVKKIENEINERIGIISNVDLMGECKKAREDMKRRLASR
ncbi:hypothetical protein ACJZ2D_002070 [Fusarium nematophilum]